MDLWDILKIVNVIRKIIEVIKEVDLRVFYKPRLERPWDIT